MLEHPVLRYLKRAWFLRVPIVKTTQLRAVSSTERLQGPDSLRDCRRVYEGEKNA